MATIFRGGAHVALMVYVRVPVTNKITSATRKSSFCEPYWNLRRTTAKGEGRDHPRRGTQGAIGSLTDKKYVISKMGNEQRFFTQTPKH